MKKWKFLFLLACAVIFLPGKVAAQANCYETQRQKGIELYNKGEYSAAYKNFEAAKMCTDLPSNNDLDTWLGKCNIVVKLSVKTLNFNATGTEEQCVDVSTNAKSFKVGSTPSWCKVTQQGKTLYVSCQDNVAVAPRDARIVVTSGGKTVFFEVIQKSADLEVEFQPENLLLKSTPETRQVLVHSNAPDWEVQNVPSWLLTERKEDTLFVVSSNNVSSAFREAELLFSFAGQSIPFSVRQQPGDTIIEVNQPELVFPREGRAFDLTVSSSIDSWNADASQQWIGVERKGNKLTVAVTENKDVFSRHGFVRIAVGNRSVDVPVHQAPYVSEKPTPVSDLQGLSEIDKESIMVTSFPSELVVYVDDTIQKITPFSHPVDFEHHSLQMGFERRDVFFNGNQGDIVFEPGLRFATLTLTTPNTFGLMSGFVTSNLFGAYGHAQFTTPFVKEFEADTVGLAGYHLTFGAVYQPIPYLGVYAGLGLGAFEARPHIGIEFEMGVMGFYKNAILSMGFHTSRVNSSVKHTGFMIGVGGYLKRFYDQGFDYCTSDSRRWWSVNYMFRPAQRGKGVMFSDIGSEKTRVYIKALYLNPTPTVKGFDASAGVVFTPAGGLVDVTMGVGAGVNVMGLDRIFQGIDMEMGAILNLWRIPVTFMLHESDLFGNRHLYVDFGVGFHFGDFKHSSYK